VRQFFTFRHPPSGMTTACYGGRCGHVSGKIASRLGRCRKGLSIILVVMMHSAYGVGEETGGTGYLHYVIGWATPFRMPSSS
jgi:hypothetical protein